MLLAAWKEAGESPWRSAGNSWGLWKVPPVLQSGVPRAAMIKCKISTKNRSWSELEGFWMTMVMGWLKMDASEGEGKDRDAAVR